MRHILQWFMHLYGLTASVTEMSTPPTLFMGYGTPLPLGEVGAMQCRINHVADVANATGLRPQVGLWK